MFPVTPPGSANDLSRARLRKIASWIRDELDPVISRDGPERLRIDDVLVLHDIFQALRNCTTFTALDLRATGIHRAVMDVSGMATRWPGRLADDCDKIITTWTAKFGRLDDLRPFLYGRGGRLEGIAHADEFSKQSLLKRWQQTCPERLTPRRSHKHGDLGFRAGAWWINPLFAYHAGIIDLETIEGGVCSDKNSAFAVLLKDNGELDAPSENGFTYRCPANDKGKYRLTAATPKSRCPIRVLRSHSINSIWGPRAGVRYEGLYRVAGWSIHQMKQRTSSNQEFRWGNIVCDVRFERDDSVSMEEVMKHPTAAELDDYSEYKRLRKLQRDAQRKGIAVRHLENPGLHTPLTRAAPPIPPLASITQAKSPSKSSLHEPLSHSPVIGETPRPSRQTSGKTISLSAMTAIAEPDLSPGRGTPEVSAQATLRSTNMPETPFIDLRVQSSKNVSSESGHTAGSHPTDIRTVAPWIDHDPSLSLPSPTGSTPPVVQHEPPIRATPKDIFKKEQAIASSRSLHLITKAAPSVMPAKSSQKLGNEGAKIHGISPLVRVDSRSKDGLNRTVGRSEKPLGKNLDGTGSFSDLGEYISYQRLDSLSATPSLFAFSPERIQASSSNDPTHDSSPITARLLNPTNPFFQGRRDAVFGPDGFTSVPQATCFNTNAIPFARTQSDDPFVNTTHIQPRESSPASLNRFISRPTAARPISSSVSSSMAEPMEDLQASGPGSQAANSLKKMVARNQRSDAKNLGSQGPACSADSMSSGHVASDLSS